MGIILNNLLDNTVEVCEKLETGKGFICLSLKRKKQFLLLEVENSFDRAVPVQTCGKFNETEYPAGDYHRTWDWA